MYLQKTTLRPKCPKLRGNLSNIIYPCFGEIKYDGEWNMFIIRKDKAYMLNKYGLKRHGGMVNTIAEALNWTPCILVGELFYGEGKNGDLYKLISNKASDELSYVPFDILEYKGVDMTGDPFAKRTTKLNELTINHQPRRTIEELENLPAKQIFFKQTIDQGYEGIVLKNYHSLYFEKQLDWVKIKDKDTCEYAVTIIDPSRERIEVLVGSRFVGVKVSDEIKQTLSVGDVVLIEHQGVLSDGGLRHPVYKGKA